VTLTFPRSEHDVEDSPVTAATKPANVHISAPPASRGDVLLVEDDPTVADVTIEMLKTTGYAVVYVKSAAAALETLAGGRAVDVVLSDVMMPGGMNGVDLAREIRKRRPDLPVVLTTGYIEVARTAMAEGLEVLVKPFQFEALAAILDSHISERMARAQ
jgi:CheY-like chemotaxis protein